ncbi:hypothetical protein E4N80_02930 [Treponema denticola]|uniref:hypothetical protein n=1 Tax=Treponema denticola TaxID=158 RepID=UPI0020A4C850|nr:hypothetical protein [Treponema denticola]UTD04504.1 hypothetical protein E4N80_02930 [Treponema denticola]
MSIRIERRRQPKKRNHPAVVRKQKINKNELLIRMCKSAPILKSLNIISIIGDRIAGFMHKTDIVKFVELLR